MQTVMAKSYQLVAWTDKGKVRMIPSQLKAYISEEVQHLNRINERVRYGTYHEVGDLLSISWKKLTFGPGFPSHGKCLNLRTNSFALWQKTDLISRKRKASAS